MNEPDNFKLMDVLQEYVNKDTDKIPPIVTGFTLILELTDVDGQQQTVTATAPQDSMAKTLGHLDYMETKAKNQMEHEDYGGE